MKKLLLTSAAGVLLFSGGVAGIGAVQADQANDQTPANQVSSENVINSSSLQKYTEYEVLEERVDDVEDYQADVVANNSDKRVIILSDDDNQEQYKSVFIKDTERLKIIDLDNGPIFNDVVTNAEADDEDEAAEDENESSDEESDEVDDYQEFETLENEVNADDDQAQVEKDNDNKRVMTVQAEDSQNEYKSVFIKNENRLKIIDQDNNNGQVFNQVLTKSDKQETDDENEAEDENESSNEESDEVDDFPEFETLENEVNADDDQAKIVKDNDNKRVMTVQAEDSQNEYKSVFIKDENRLKIIDQDNNNGQVFNQVIK